MRSAILGYTGLVGSYISGAIDYAVRVSRSNLESLYSEPFEWLYISAMPAEKWKANKFPEDDLASLDSLKHTLANVRARRVVLISTVDVYSLPQGVDEDAEPIPGPSNIYGRNRLQLEKFVESTFEHTWVVRLPGLVSPWLKKNLLFDLKNGKPVSEVPINSSFQFYPLGRIGKDLSVIQDRAPGIYHFAPNPLVVSEIAERLKIESSLFAPTSSSAPNYDLRTKFASLWGRSGNYMVSHSESLDAIEGYLS